LIGLPVGAPGLPPRAVHAIPGAARRGAWFNCHCQEAQRAGMVLLPRPRPR
jgi:hypothetical protein